MKGDKTKLLWQNPDYRNHMSEVHKGQKWTRWQKEFNRIRMLGNKINLNRIPWNKGKGNLTKYQRYKNDKRHNEWREKVFKRDNYTCQECGAKSGNGKRVDLNADHIKAYALYPELRFDVNNGRTLCLDCHYKTETFGGKILNFKKEFLLKVDNNN